MDLREQFNKIAGKLDALDHPVRISAWDQLREKEGEEEGEAPGVAAGMPGITTAGEDGVVNALLEGAVREGAATQGDIDALDEEGRKRYAAHLVNWGSQNKENMAILSTHVNTEDLAEAFSPGEPTIKYYQDNEGRLYQVHEREVGGLRKFWDMITGKETPTHQVITPRGNSQQFTEAQFNRAMSSTMPVDAEQLEGDRDPAAIYQQQRGSYQDARRGAEDMPDYFFDKNEGILYEKSPRGDGYRGKYWDNQNHEWVSSGNLLGMGPARSRYYEGGMEFVDGTWNPPEKAEGVHQYDSLEAFEDSVEEDVGKGKVGRGIWDDWGDRSERAQTARDDAAKRMAEERTIADHTQPGFSSESWAGPPGQHRQRREDEKRQRLEQANDARREARPDGLMMSSEEERKQWREEAGRIDEQAVEEREQQRMKEIRERELQQQEEAFERDYHDVHGGEGYYST